MATLKGSGGKPFLRMTEAFFDRKSVLDAVNAAEAKVLSRFGSFVRKTARRSIKKPRRKRRSELTASERVRLGLEQDRDTRGRFTSTGKVTLPLASSQPGEPPRNQTGKLKGSIFFGFDKRTSSVVSGPVRLSGLGTAPRVLEEGGSGPRRGRIKARPFMGPALKKELPKLAPMWRDSVKV